MTSDEYAAYDAIGLRKLIAAGEVSAEEVESAARRALEVANATVNGLAAPPFVPALEHATDGALAGVPFLIKDFGPMARGVPFFCGSRSVSGVVARRDSDLMTRVRSAGLVTLGLTTAPEFAVSFATEPLRSGPTRNPWDPERGAGGSSGGSAALVAARAVPIAHGNDGAGSIRVPASCCGLVGLKPSRGRTPSDPDAGDTLLGLTVDGALTRSVRDTAHFLDAIHGTGRSDKFTVSPPSRPYAAELTARPKRLRVALTTAAWSGAPVDRQVASAAQHTAQLLAECGHSVTEAGPAVDWEAGMHVMRAGLLASTEPFLAAPRRPAAEKLEAGSRNLMREAQAFPARELIAAVAAQHRITRAVAAFFADHDLLVTPTLAQLPAPHGRLRYDDESLTSVGWLHTIFNYGPFTAVFNVTGQPAISVPLTHSDDGLPIGVQLVARHGREDLLLAVAAQLEAAEPWHQRRPSQPTQGGTTMLT